MTTASKNANKVSMADKYKESNTHFILTQFQTILVAVFVTGMMQLSNHLSIYLIYYCPIYFLLMALYYFIWWRNNQIYSPCFNLYNFFLFVICLSVFYGVFFGVFHNTAKIEFQKAQNCQIIGQYKAKTGYENYSLLYVNFEYEGQQYLGQACASDQNQGKIAQSIQPYVFFQKQRSCMNNSTIYGDEVAQTAVNYFVPSLLQLKLLAGYAFHSIMIQINILSLKLAILIFMEEVIPKQIALTD
ncbi:transmembrane protein, putative (macronuclear) [Tetrahymena thermophila SB210]|uniref:Transmembrane protein, putative n=1 Tax=Tetrahymena thermophila (strain SB210) TaxID=312017 RepID=Q22SU3_TETTS|nr:transmembrane protein, putative [Tetrahymena thermophila SB210]EAR88371.2 transmembrane protein, putative [Tetrahymena thermophila SB210]|eukprot:XP_001008616.2 transmembrane protein, putative [Tetrahymena thermophila SB210]